MIKLTTMKPEEYERWREHITEHYAADLELAGNRDHAGAVEKARQDMERAIPQGLASPNQWLYSIQNESGQKVGVIWYQCQDQAGADEAFILDLEIYPEFRRHGYAEQAMQAVEAEARERGMRRIGLHVFGFNTGAIRLYEKLGFVATNINMSKSIE